MSVREWRCKLDHPPPSIEFKALDGRCERFHPTGGGPEDDKDGQEAWFTARNRIPYWIDRRLAGLAGPDYDATISFGLPFEPEDSQYGESRFS